MSDGMSKKELAVMAGLVVGTVYLLSKEGVKPKTIALTKSGIEFRYVLMIGGAALAALVLL